MTTRLTVDDLARASGLNTSTIRLYRHRGLLHAPAIEGRVGYYDDTHLARLRLIGELQERGFSLAAIRDLVDSWEAGRDLGSVLGVEGALVHAEETVTMTRDEFAARLPDVSADPGLLDRCVALRAVALRPDGDLDVGANFLAVSGVLQGLAIPLATMLDEFAPIREFARTTADRFVTLFESDFLARAPNLDAGTLAAMIPALRQAATDVVTGALQQAIDEAAAEALARWAADGTGVGATVN